VWLVVWGLVVLVVLPMTGSTSALVLVWVVLVGVVVWELHSGREHLAGRMHESVFVLHVQAIY